MNKLFLSEENYPELIEFKKYSIASGMPYSPHRYPEERIKEANRFFRPWLMSDQEIKDYTGI